MASLSRRVREIDVKHCFLIIIDALRADRIGIYNKRFEDLTRCLTELGRKGIVFKNAFTVINATDPSLTSIYTGLYPSSQGLVNHGELVTEEELQNVSAISFLQEILNKFHVRTFAIDWLRRWHKRGFKSYIDPKGFFRNFESILGKLRELVKRWGVHTPYTAEEAFAKVKSIVKRYRHKRTFILVHLWDTHTPYNAMSERYEEIRKRYRGKPWDRPLIGALESIKGSWKDMLIKMFSPNATLGDIVARYDSAVARVDSAVKDFIEFLEELKLLDETLIIITSDHGESLIEHGIYFDHHGLYEPSVRIPLIIYNPRLTPHEVHSFVQNIDIMPTILEIFGIKVNTSFIDGRSLLELILEKENAKSIQLRREVFIEESYTERKLAVRTERYKYILAIDPRKAICRYCGYVHGGSLEELYDLEKDPEETVNIAINNPDIVRDLRKVLESYIKRFEIRKRIRKIAKTMSARLSRLNITGLR